MVALLHPSPNSPSSSSTSVEGRPGLRLIVDNTVVDNSVAGDAASDAGGARPRVSAWPAVDRSMMLTIAAVAAVVFGSLFVLRAVQGAPAVDAATGSVSVGPAQATSVVVAAPGDQVVVAKAGDSMWSIAVSLDPNADPRPAVAALIDANGGDSVRIGQQIVIPKQLLD